ncbi:MAG: hypothetical protein Q4A44_00020 [Bacteroidales bacterium]|nr:hypothetical protein [Bacteroidales bacterium]
MKQIYSTIKTLALAAMAMVATTATAQEMAYETTEFSSTFLELQKMFNFPVSKTGDEAAGNLKDKPINFGLFTLSATDVYKTPTRMWESVRKNTTDTTITLRVYKGSSVTIKANNPDVRLTSLTFTSSSYNPASGFTASTGTYVDSVWTGEANEITFTSDATKPHVYVSAVKVTLKTPTVTNIASATTAPGVLAGTTPVYNLQGQRVGTYGTFLTLPKGIYIIGGQKVVR